MKVVLLLAQRNLRLYTRDRAGVLFSLLGPLILLGLYALFLGRLQADALAQTLPTADSDDVLVFVFAWVFAGVTMITTLTTGLAAMSSFVEDRASGRFADFLVSPPTRLQLVLGYLISSFAVAFVLSVLVALVGQFALLAVGGPLLGATQLASLLGVIALSAASFSALSGFAAAFLGTTAAFAAFSTVTGTVLGFLAGAYIPPGVLPIAVVNVINTLPFAQSAMLLRQPFVDQALDQMTGGNAAVIDELNSYYGMTLSLGGADIGNPIAIAELSLLLILFALLGAWRIGRAIR